MPNNGGRPALEPGRRRLVKTIRLSPEQQTKLARLGGSRWVREQAANGTAVPPDSTRDSRRRETSLSFTEATLRAYIDLGSGAWLRALLDIQP